VVIVRPVRSQQRHFRTELGNRMNTSLIVVALWLTGRMSPSSSADSGTCWASTDATNLAIFCSGHLLDPSLDVPPGHPPSPAPATPCTWCDFDVIPPEVPSSACSLPWLHIVHVCSSALGRRAFVMSPLRIHQRCYLKCSGDVNVIRVHGRDGEMIMLRWVQGISEQYCFS
jgi:hypothetical protein